MSEGFILLSEGFFSVYSNLLICNTSRIPSVGRFIQIEVFCLSKTPTNLQHLFVLVSCVYTEGFLCIL